MVGRKVRLEEIVHFHYGKSLKADERNGGPFNVYGSNGVVGQHSEKIADYDTIIVGRKGSVGKVTMALGGGWPIDTTYYVEIKDEDAVNLKFLYYSLKKADLVRHSITTSIPGINRKTLNSVEIFLPPLDEQERIAAILDKADEIKSTSEQTLDTRIEFLNAVFFQLFEDALTDNSSCEYSMLNDCSQFIDYRGQSPPKITSRNPSNHC